MIEIKIEEGRKDLKYHIS